MAGANEGQPSMGHTTVGALYDSCVAHYGSQVALKFRQRTCTYEELGENAYRLANAFRVLGLRKGARLLDAGCGYGRHLIPLAGRGVDIVGGDLSQFMLGESSRQIKKTVDSTAFPTGSLT